MGAHSVPVRVACGETSISMQGPGKGAPTLSMGLNLSIPIEELLKAMVTFQSFSEESSPATRVEKRVEVKPEVVSAQNVPKPFLLPEDHETPVDDTAADKVRPPGEDMGPPPGLDPPPAPSGPPLGLSANWESIPKPLSLTAEESQCCSVKIKNLLKGLRSRHIQHLLTSEVGEVSKCNVADCEAIVTFKAAEHAQNMVRMYDGGVLEVKVDSDKEDLDRVRLKPLWQSNGGCHLLEAYMGPLTECHFRRGDAWLTMVKVNKWEKKSDYKVDFKGSIIGVAFSLDPPPPPS
eukprot:TRINITY_DN98112_c0_g1_i1.p1 TRINITY_DN98112_c0_g1~~TRINITY_DN98112_c0_g1_i1.p1  ORF type:complete len:291 (+),score=60.87 TRINITY_DN98112_c0_g1_i1:89-961(+)